MDILLQTLICANKQEMCADLRTRVFSNCKTYQLSLHSQKNLVAKNNIDKIAKALSGMKSKIQCEETHWQGIHSNH